MAVYDLCVVGAGMIGSAAARHASRDPAVKVCLVGPSEPENGDVKTSRDIFGCHYDEGRITRSCDADPVWATLGQESIKRYRAIEKEAGIDFYKEVGLLWVGSKSSDEITAIRNTAASQCVPVKELSHKDLSKQYPYLKLAKDDIGVLEEQNAGHISPRKLVAAQKVIAMKQGCKIIDDTVSSVERAVQNDGSYVMQVLTEGGNQIISKAVLLATGAFTNFRNLLPPGQKPEQELMGSSVALVEVDDAYREKVKNMPTIFYCGIGHPDHHKFPRRSNECYILPSIQYPDGRYYIKLGFCDETLPVRLSSCSEVKAWYDHGNIKHGENTATFMGSLFKGLKLNSWHPSFCVITKTPTKLPYIDKVHDQLGVAICGNGHAAKSSDEIGRLAVDMMTRRWSSDIPRDVFKLRLETHDPPPLMEAKL